MTEAAEKPAQPQVIPVAPKQHAPEKDVMTSSLNDSMKHTFEAAQHDGARAAKSVRSSWAEGVHVASSIISIARSLGVDDALGWIGLSRRRGGLSTFTTFGAGMAVGAAVGVMFAPMSGRDLRHSVLEKLSALNGSTKKAVLRVEADVEDATSGLLKKVEHAVGMEPTKNGGAKTDGHKTA
jgi:hypothetical protein